MVYARWMGVGRGKFILEFSLALHLTIANVWFRKTNEHLITYKSGVICSTINFFLIRNSNRKICLDYRVISRESLIIQHRVLVMDVRIDGRAKRRSHTGASQFKWWHFKGEKQWIFQHKILGGRVLTTTRKYTYKWYVNKMTQEIRKVAKETLSEWW